MKRKILLLMTLLGLSNSCFAYYDTPLYATMSPPMNLTTPGPAPNAYGLGYNSSAALRERENDFYRQQRLNQPSMSATVQSLTAPQETRIHPYSNNTSSSSTPSHNPNRDYVQSKPLPLKGIYSYDAYGN